jgi:hypothetical protein
MRTFETMLSGCFCSTLGFTISYELAARCSATTCLIRLRGGGVLIDIRNYLTPWRQVHHRIHKNPLPATILSQLDSIYTPPTNLPEIHSDPIYAFVFQVVAFLLAFPPETLYTFLSSPCEPHVPPTSFSLSLSA